MVLFQQFVSELLSHQGALVERNGDGELEALLPRKLQKSLDLPEHAHLHFGVPESSRAEHVSFDPDWISRFAKVLDAQGRCLRIDLELDNAASSSPERYLNKSLQLTNAIYRLQEIKEAIAHYLVLTFHYSALSDEKREGILRYAINLTTGAINDCFAEKLQELLSSHDHRINCHASFKEKIIERKVIEQATQQRVRARLNPFLLSMKRREERDLSRLYDYHQGLRRESLLRLAAKQDTQEREHQRLVAIQREYQSKVADLKQKYAMKIDIHWMQTVEVIVPVQRYCLKIKRRKNERSLILDWNSLTRELESPCCEATCDLSIARFACDDALHLVSPDAHEPCVACSRPFCRACHKSRCPQCQKPILQDVFV